MGVMSATPFSNCNRSSCTRQSLVAISESKKSVALETLVKWATYRRSKDDKTVWLLEAQRVETVEETVMTRDEWTTRGLLFASRAEAEEDLDEQEKWLSKSLGPFKLGGIESNKKRVQLHLQSVQVRKALSQLGPASGLDNVTTNERAVSALIQDLMEEKIGLGAEVAKLCVAFHVCLATMMKQEATHQQARSGISSISEEP